MHDLMRKDEGLARKVGDAQPIDVKALTEDGRFEGYASMFGDLDQGCDIVMPGAFADSLVKTPAARIKLLWHHDPKSIVGKWLEVREDARGLYVKGQIFTGLPRGEEARMLMKEGALDGLSIGYRTLVDEVDRETGVRRLLKVDLKEISIVTFPMQASATVQLVKGDEWPSERELERYLRDGGFSAREAKVIIADGFKALRTERDAGLEDNEGPDDVGALNRLAEMLRA